MPVAIRMSDRSSSNGLHRTREHSPDVHDSNVHWLAAMLIGFALFAGVAGIAALVAPHDAATADAVRGAGLLIGTLLTVGVALWTNRKRSS
jgi:hypothetical protein